MKKRALLILTVFSLTEIIFNGCGSEPHKKNFDITILMNSNSDSIEVRKSFTALCSSFGDKCRTYRFFPVIRIEMADSLHLNQQANPNIEEMRNATQKFFGISPRFASIMDELKKAVQQFKLNQYLSSHKINGQQSSIVVTSYLQTGIPLFIYDETQNDRTVAIDNREIKLFSSISKLKEAIDNDIDAKLSKYCGDNPKEESNLDQDIKQLKYVVLIKQVGADSIKKSGSDIEVKHEEVIVNNENKGNGLSNIFLYNEGDVAGTVKLKTTPGQYDITFLKDGKPIGTNYSYPIASHQSLTIQFSIKNVPKEGKANIEVVTNNAKDPVKKVKVLFVQKGDESKIGNLEYDYGKYNGEVRKGVMHGSGTYYYYKKTRISILDGKNRYAEAGEMIKGQWNEGSLDYGILCDKNGNPKDTIIIGRLH